MPINISSLVKQSIPKNRGYLLKKAADSSIDLSEASILQKGFVKASELTGETFNNTVTAVGTAAIAPIFIINNPLAKEDKSTKKYTAARQPISAGITLGFQVPIMAAYNKLIRDYVTEHHLDRCDLHAAPSREYLNNLVNAETNKFIFENPDALDYLRKKDIKDLIYQKERNNAFYNELRMLREAVQKNENIPEYLKKCMDSEGYILIEKMISPTEYEEAEKLIVQDLLKAEYNMEFDKKGKLIKIGENVLSESEQKDIKTIKDLHNKKILKLFKQYGIDTQSEQYKSVIAEASDENITKLASENVKALNFSHAKIKFKQAELAKEAKAKSEAYGRELVAQGLKKEEINRLLVEKDKQLFQEMKNEVEKLMQSAPEFVETGDRTLTKHELSILSEKLKSKTDNQYNKAGLTEAEQKIKALKDKIYNCFAGDHKVKYLKTNGRETFEDTLKDVQVKKWLTTRINNSEKIFKNFKTMTGVVVGLLILPFTCSFLNWAYPRIMEEFFPKLAHAKAEASKAKEAK